MLTDPTANLNPVRIPASANCASALSPRIRPWARLRMRIFKVILAPLLTIFPVLAQSSQGALDGDSHKFVWVAVIAVFMILGIFSGLKNLLRGKDDK